MKWLMRGCAIAALAASPMAAQADTVTVATTLDLTQTSPDGYYRGAAFSPPFSVNVAEGDTFDYTIDFLGGQTLTVTNLSYIWAFTYSAPGEGPADFSATGTFSFLDSAGASLFTTAPKTGDEGEAHIGQQFGGGDLAGLPSTFTFYGVRYVGLIEDYHPPALDPNNPDDVLDPELTNRAYNDPSFTFQAGRSEIGGIVPEPATWGLMIVGFGLVGGLLRRRRDLVPA